MSACRCGSEARYDFGCIECGTPCCPDCSVQLESANYCAACADSLVGTSVRAPKSLLI